MIQVKLKMHLVYAMQTALEMYRTSAIYHNNDNNVQRADDCLKRIDKALEPKKRKKRTKKCLP